MLGVNLSRQETSFLGVQTISTMFILYMTTTLNVYLYDVEIRRMITPEIKRNLSLSQYDRRQTALGHCIVLNRAESIAISKRYERGNNLLGQVHLEC